MENTNILGAVEILISHGSELNLRYSVL